MPVRNHVTVIKPADAQAKVNEGVEQKARGEVRQPDPQDAAAALEKNQVEEIDGNGSGTKFTLKKESDRVEARQKSKQGGPNPNTVLDAEEQRTKKAGQKPAADKEESGDKPAEEGLKVTHPASSQEQGGKDVSERVG
jgi:hypothetical protein